MITRKFVYGGVIAMMVAGSALSVHAQANSTPAHPRGLFGTLTQVIQHFESILSPQAQATPQPTAQPAAKPTAAPTAAPTAVPVPQAPYLGVRLEDTAKGVAVRDVLEGSPAASAGLKVNDLIQKANGTAVKNVIEFAQFVLKMKPDENLKLEIMRENKADAVTIKVGGLDKSKAFELPAAMPYDGFTYDAASKLWNVFQLSEHSLLYSAGLRTNDQITGFDGTIVAPADYQTYRDSLKPDANVKLTLKSAGKDKTVTVPAAALQSLDAFSYNDSGLLIEVLPAGGAPAPKLENLAHVTPYNAIAYDGKEWMVYSLVDGDPLQMAGLAANDHITAFDGKSYDPATMRTWLGKLADNTTLKLTVDRAGKKQEISVPAGDITTLYLIGDKTSGLFFGLPTNRLPSAFGADAVTLTKAIVAERKLKQDTGALITFLQPKSAADASGLKLNDIITAIGTDKIDASHDFNSLLTALKPGENITLDVLRGDKTMQVKATLPTPDVTGELPFLIDPL